MRPFVRETGVLVPLPRADVDTDQIIPKVFLKRVDRTGYGPLLFHDWRYDGDGRERPGFVLNDARYRGGSILVAGRNFGCGSSREHAVWALQQAGIHAVIAPSFADIFRGNAAKGGLLTVVLPEDAVGALLDRATAAPGTTATVDLEEQTVVAADLHLHFDHDPAVRRSLLEGVDEIAATLRAEAAIEEFESRRPAWMPNAGALDSTGGVAR